MQALRMSRRVIQEEIPAPLNTALWTDSTQVSKQHGTGRGAEGGQQPGPEVQGRPRSTGGQVRPS